MGLIRWGAIAIALVATTAGELQAQRRITGRVVEEGSNTPLGNVSVNVSGSGIGAYTTDQGTFTLTVPNGAVSLRVRRIGYQLRTALVGPTQSTVDIALKRDVLQLEGVTVTSQSSVIERKNAATAVSQVTSEQIARVPAAQLDQDGPEPVADATDTQRDGAIGHRQREAAVVGRVGAHG